MIPIPLIKSITAFGDLSVLLPLSAILLIWLLVMRSGRGAAWWLFALVVCAGGTALLKIYFSACPIGHELNSPSGHTSFSALVYGALAVIVAVEASAVWSRRLAVAVAALLIIAIAASRLALGAHSSVEIVIGLILGLLGLSIFLLGYLSKKPARPWLAPLLIGAMLVAVLSHGRELHAEQLLHAISLRFHVASYACPSVATP